MTTHVHQPSPGAPPARSAAVPGAVEDAPASARPGWLIPALAAGLVGIGLVAAGIVSLSTMFYVAAIGGMLLMHTGGHGSHGGHGSAGGHAAGQGTTRPGGHDGHRDPEHGETGDGDQQLSHGCH